MNKNFKSQAQGGFTLIELIVVIVILGILAATALPKFIDLGADAREASLKGAKGAVTSASALVHGKWLVERKEDVTVDGVAGGVKVNAAGFPTAKSIIVAAGLSDADYIISPSVATVTDNDATVTITPKGVDSAHDDKCRITYTAATGVASVDSAINCK